MTDYIYKLEKSTGRILQFENEQHWLDWSDYICHPFDVGDTLLLDLEKGEKGIELVPTPPVRPPKVVRYLGRLKNDG